MTSTLMHLLTLAQTSTESSSGDAVLGLALVVLLFLIVRAFVKGFRS